MPTEEVEKEIGLGPALFLLTLKSTACYLLALMVLFAPLLICFSTNGDGATTSLGNLYRVRNACAAGS